MCTLLKVMCQNGFKKRITLPKDWFIRTDNHILITYLIDNHTRFITLERGEDCAEFLKEHGVIDNYEGSGNYLKMYEKKLFTVTGKNGEPIQWERTSELDWYEIKFYPSDAIHFASVQEYERQGSILGLVEARAKAKIRTINTHFYPKAA